MIEIPFMRFLKANIVGTAELTTLHTLSPYSSSKASADLLIMAYYRTYGLPTTISRCSSIYGSFQFPETSFEEGVDETIK